MNAHGPISRDDLKALVREAVREELDAAGLRIHDPENRDEAREDFRFLRRLRKGIDSAANKIGMAVILALVTGVIGATWAGIRYALRA